MKKRQRKKNQKKAMKELELFFKANKSSLARLRWECAVEGHEPKYGIFGVNGYTCARCGVRLSHLDFHASIFY
jgi:hypothetical protein